jgi:hypothetical protein
LEPQLKGYLADLGIFLSFPPRPSAILAILSTGADVPGKGWNVLLRLYGPLEPWFNKTWRPGEFEVVK